MRESQMSTSTLLVGIRSYRTAHIIFEQGVLGVGQIHFVPWIKNGHPLPLIVLLSLLIILPADKTRSKPKESRTSCNPGKAEVHVIPNRSSSKSKIKINPQTHRRYHTRYNPNNQMHSILLAQAF